ncbi:MAG: hypothetical protein Q9175_007658 [Cornicularia normoerica]
MSDIGSNFDALNQSLRDSQLDAYNSASESSEKSSAYSSDRSRSRGRPRKRKTTEDLISSQPSLKRLKSSYSNDYRVLFNSTVVEIVSSHSSETDDLLQESQIGVTVWSSEEKGAFFRSLARRGRQDVRGIATDIGSKSESEVYVYSDMLYKAAIDQQIYGTRKTLLETSKVEAALEVRGECCAALDLAAVALSALQQIEEESDEKKRHKELAFLTPRIARWVEHRIAVPEGGMEELSQQIPAARLLNLLNFLALSRRFFMNSVIAEDNWRSYTGRKYKSPSIMYTAFSDFHALSISITQRLVQSSLFFAMSRLRAMSASGHYTPGSHVRRRDVMAALNVLGMKSDAKAFWAGTARKCKLRVYDKVRHRHAFGKKYSYVEVEKILSPSMISNPDSPEIMTEDANTSTSRKGRAQTVSPASVSQDSISSDSTSIEADRSSTLSNDKGLSATPLASTNKQDDKQDEHGQLQDAYVEALDQQASLNEERRLWMMLGEDPAEKMQPVDVKLPNGPFPNRKDHEGLLDWRDGLEYAGDWEMRETLLYGSSFAINRSLRKDVDSAAGLANSISSMESLVSDDSIKEDDDLESDEDANGDGATNNDGASTSSADDAGRWTGSNDCGPDRALVKYSSY